MFILSIINDEIKPFLTKLNKLLLRCTLIKYPLLKGILLKCSLTQDIQNK